MAENTQTATLGEYLIKNSGISDQVAALAEQFAEMAKSRNFYTWIVYADDENGNGNNFGSDRKAVYGHKRKQKQRRAGSDRSKRI